MPPLPRKIPATMATQHPDNACAAFFCNKKFINTMDEIEECYISYKDLKCGEYMWDWEGKFVDEAVIEKLFQQYTDFFKKQSLGRDIFLTFRIPNIWEESSFRLARAYMSILTASDFAKDLGFHTPPIFEVILPMTTNAKQLIHVQETFQKVAQLKKQVFETKQKSFDMINVIPLFESVDNLSNTPTILEEYFRSYKKEFGGKPEYLRPFIARSDPALNAGIVPAVLASKVAISDFFEIGEKYGVKMYPIIGTGSLPFRGGVNPENIAETIDEYSGIRTMTIQPAFRYDYPIDKVKKALKLIDKSLPTFKPRILNKEEKETINKINKIFGKFYKTDIEAEAEFINTLAGKIPSRRERMLHIGLFGYSRGMGKVSLPRAIKFTAAWYSIGVPPEFIGTGRGLKKIKEMGLSGFVKDLYMNLESDLVHAGKYLNKENLESLAKSKPVFKNILEDVRLTEEFLGKELGPYKTHHYIHRNLVSSVYLHMKVKEDFSDELEKAAMIRKSLG